MKIYRDGKAIELTKKELEAAYNEFDTCKYKEQIQQVIKDMRIEIVMEDTDFDEIMHRIENELSDNDTYWDIYHCAIADVINAYIAERGIA